MEDFSVTPTTAQVLSHEACKPSIWQQGHPGICARGIWTHSSVAVFILVVACLEVPIGSGMLILAALMVLGHLWAAIISRQQLRSSALVSAQIREQTRARGARLGELASDVFSNPHLFHLVCSHLAARSNICLLYTSPSPRDS